jgi:hypothetical protein
MLCEGMQSSADFTGCVEVAGIMGVLFDTESGGLAIYGTFIVALFFGGVAATVTVTREKDPLMANYPRTSAIWNSMLPGFAFGSFLFLVAAIIGTRPDIAVTIIVSRLMHMFGSGLILFILFGPADQVRERLQGQSFTSELSLLRGMIHKPFAQDNVYLVEIVSFLSLCDGSMLQFLPWKKSKYFTASEGYVTSTLMKYSLSIKVFETTINAICETVYLSEINADTLAEDKALALARVLFILNIIVGIVMVLMEVLVLFLRSGILADSEEDTPQAVEEKEKEKEKPTTFDDSFDAGEIYKPKRDSILEYSENPLLSFNRTQSEPQRKVGMMKIKKDEATDVEEGDRDTIQATHSSSSKVKENEKEVEFHI